MPLELDPDRNPVLRLYALFPEKDRNPSGVEVDDGVRFLAVRGLRLTELDARGLVRQLRGVRAMLDTCSLCFGSQQLASFVAAQVEDWFDWQAIDELAGEDRIGEEAKAAFDELKDTVGLGNFPPDTDPADECLWILKDLAECGDDRFTLDIRLNKSAAVEAFLVPASTAVSASAWWDFDSFLGAFDSFDDFFEFFEEQARQPLALLFYRPVEEHAGDYVRVLRLRDPAGPERRRSALAVAVAALATQAKKLDELMDLHRRERRVAGDRVDLPPALLLPGGAASTDCEHPVFATGPLRSVLLYAVLAWLAERTHRASACFDFQADGDDRNKLTLRFGMDDVWHEGESLFRDPKTWQQLVSLARAVQSSAGDENLRALWARALPADPSEAFAPGRLWQGLEDVHRNFLDLERAARGAIPKELDEAPSCKAEKAARAEAHANRAYGELPDFELRIFVERRGLDKYARFELHGPFRGLFHEDRGEKPLRPHPAARDDEFDELSNMARGEMTRLLVPDEPNHRAAWQPKVSSLEDWGNEQWSDLIPEELKAEYFKMRHEQGLSLLIVSSDPSFPWELTKPYLERDDDDFWAMQFRLGRWLAGQRPPADEIRCDRVLCVSTTQLDSSAEEKRYFEGIRSELTSLEMPETKAELKKLLKEETFDLIHFACHGEFNAEYPEDSVIQLPDGDHFIARELNNGKIEAGIREGRPLVFLNACHTGRVGSTRTDIGGWAKRFIAKGCGAFIGCGWEVADPLAAKFATTFYDELRRRDDQGGPAATLGDAVHVARQAVRKDDQGNSTWLAYYLYGNPNCRLVTP